MNEDVINDFKQFITAAVSQQTVTLRADIAELKQDVNSLKQDVGDLKQDVVGLQQDVGSLKQDIARLDRKIDDLSGSVAEALDTANDGAAAQLADHETRIVRLEHHTA